MVNNRQLFLRTVNEDSSRMVDFKALEPRLRQSTFHLPCLQDTGHTKHRDHRSNFQYLTLYFGVRM